MGPVVVNGLIWLIGHLASKGTDKSTDSVLKIWRNRDLLKELDQYNNEVFKDFPELRDALGGKKKELVDLAKKCLSEAGFNSSETARQKFIGDACGLVNISFKDVKAYFDYIYTLIFLNLTDEIPGDIKTYIDVHLGEQRAINKGFDERITNLENGEHGGQEPVDFSPYYEKVKGRFTAEKTGDYAKLVGNESDQKAYIDAYITVGSDQVLVSEHIEEWFDNTKSGAILIYGEPGQGKSLLCDKAVFDFCENNYLKKAENVLAVSLNTGKHPSIIKDKEFVIENAFVWGAGKEDRFALKDCGGSLLFLDGFDEFIDAARQAKINNICTFMKMVKDIAYDKDMHIVVLSRKTAVSGDLEELKEICANYELSPVFEKQQDDWLGRHKDYDDYREIFNALRNNEDMAGLFGVPLLFRLIVHSRFDIISSNVVDLYDKLFAHLMKKRDVWGDARLEVENSLMDLAFKIYCTDTDMAFLKDKDWDPRWIFAFYVKALSGRKVGFFHRTFYQYFLAKYIHREILRVTDEKTAEGLIGSLAERELDNTVQDYLRMLYKKENESEVHAGIENMINALANTEAYLNPEPRIEFGDAEKSRILRSTNIYRNTFHIAAVFTYVIPFPFKGNLDRVMRTFNSDEIMLLSKSEKRANLVGADLSRANLFETDLSGADLSGADLSGAYLSEAYLIGANLRGANLSGAYLLRADLRRTELLGADMICVNLTLADLSEANLSGADLTGANLRRADLSGADLSGADLIGTNLSVADLSRAKIDIKYKEIIDPATRGYNSIIWITDIFQAK